MSQSGTAEHKKSHSGELRINFEHLDFFIMCTNPKRQPHVLIFKRRDRHTLSRCRNAELTHGRNLTKKVTTNFHCRPNKYYHALIKKSQTYHENNVLIPVH